MCASGLLYFPATLTLQYCCISRTRAEVFEWMLIFLCLVFLFYPPSVHLFFSLYSTGICSLLPKYILRNWIAAITFLLGWLTVHSNLPYSELLSHTFAGVLLPFILLSWFSSVFSFTSLPFVVSSLYQCCKADVSLILYPYLAFFILFSPASFIISRIFIILQLMVEKY